jgi:hypothetical protein
MDSRDPGYVDNWYREQVLAIPQLPTLNAASLPEPERHCPSGAAKGCRWKNERLAQHSKVHAPKGPKRASLGRNSEDQITDAVQSFLPLLCMQVWYNVGAQRISRVSWY